MSGNEDKLFWCNSGLSHLECAVYLSIHVHQLQIATPSITCLRSTREIVQKKFILWFYQSYYVIASLAIISDIFSASLQDFFSSLPIFSTTSSYSIFSWYGSCNIVHPFKIKTALNLKDHRPNLTLIAYFFLSV